MRFCLPIFFLLSHLLSIASTSADSLQKQLFSENDTIKFNGLIGLTNHHRINGKLDVATFHADSALNLSNKMEWNYGKAKSLNNLAYINIYSSDFDKAMKCAVSAHEIAETENDKENLGFSYMYIAFIKQNLGETDNVLEYYYKSLELRKELGNNYNLGFSYSYIGNYFNQFKNYDSSFFYHNKALEVRKLTKDARSIADSYLLSGSSLLKLKRYAKAQEYFGFALDIYRELNDTRRLAEIHRNYAEAYIATDQLKEAEFYLLASLDLSLEIDAVENLIPIYELLSVINEKKGNYENAFKFIKRHLTIKDSIGGRDIYKEVTKQVMEYEKNKENRIKELEFQKEQEKQEIITIAVSIGLILVIAFLFFVFNRLRLTKKQNEQISLQKAKIEASHKEITDSINYAKRIQHAILPSQEAIKECFPNSFIYYRPKDIVAGDFYWLENSTNEQITLFAVADCTGHGVPGAMTSVVCNNALNRSVHEHSLSIPSDILNKTRELTVNEFGKSNEAVKDGMDIALCSLREIDGKFELNYAGAHNPLWIIRNGANEIEEIKADKQPIGKFFKSEPFNNHTITLTKGDSLYLFTDGFADQFGGEKGKKFKYKAMRQLFLSVQNHSLEEQKNFIHKVLEDWKGDYEQIDDICILGIKL